jgi:hypothetical protein
MDNADFSRLRWWRGRADPPFSEEAFEIAAGGQGVYVFAFHPIHILMNTPDPQYYLDRREAFLQGEDLGSLRFDGYGTADFFKQACELDTEFTTVADAVERSTQDEAIVRSQSIR